VEAKVCSAKTLAALLFVSVALSSGVPLVHAQSSTPPSSPLPPAGRHPPSLLNDDTSREVIYPYYSLREGYDSKLDMMDRAPRPIEFTVGIHGMSGETLRTKPMTIQPSQELVLDVRQILKDLGADTQGDFSEGSVSLYFKGVGNPLGGRMLVETRNGNWNLGPVWRENQSGQGMIPKKLDTFWWGLGGARDVEIYVDNVSGEAQSADLDLEFNGKRHAEPPLQFGPHEMKHLNLSQMLARMEVRTIEAPAGGLSIVPHSAQPALVAQGFITDSEAKRMTGLVFPLPQVQHASALHATGVPIGTPTSNSPFAETGNFTPHVLVRNLLDSEQTVTITVEYPGKTGPQMAVLEPVRLAAYTTQDIRLDAYYSQLPLPLPYCAIRIQYNGPPGSLIGTVTTIEENSGKFSDTHARNEGDGYAGGLASYWSFDDATDDIVFFTNMGDKVCRILLSVEAGGVQHVVPRLQVGPHETAYVNLRELRDKQEPDSQGHKIPSNATSGRLEFLRMDNMPLEGRILEVPTKKIPGA
jgi:hypothetical protein